MAKSKKKMQKTTLISAIITLLSFLYKATLSVLNLSLVLMIASISSLLVFICKFLFVKNVLETREKKKKAYLFMMSSALIYSLIFIAFVVLKVNGIDLSRTAPFDGIYGIIFVAALFVLFILSVIGLKGAVEKTDLMVIGLKEMTFIAALSDLVFIESYTSLIVLKYVEFEYMDKVNAFFSLAMGVLMFVVSVRMLVRYIKYKP